MIKKMSCLFIFLLFNMANLSFGFGDNGITSIETGYTISKVRIASHKSKRFIVGSSYEGTVLGVSFEGKILWENPLSGFMNHDVWCEDLTGDGIDEILMANADGNIYCLDDKGKLQWQFKVNEAPMYAVCTIEKDNKKYVVAGGYDTNVYYLTSKGKLVKELPSSLYSIEKSFPAGKKAQPKSLRHLSNMIRKMKKKDGSEVLLIQGANNSMFNRGSLYFFNPLETKPFKVMKLVGGKPIGDLKVLDLDQDHVSEIYLGTSMSFSRSELIQVLPELEKQKQIKMSDLPKKLRKFGYKVIQNEMIKDGKTYKLMSLFGDKMILFPTDLQTEKTEILECKYSFNDMWKDKRSGKIILASAQSGGSCIHILNPKLPSWKKAYENLQPKGKIAAILKNTQEVKKNLKSFQKPSWERGNIPVYFMSEALSSNSLKNKVATIQKNYKSPIFLKKANAPRKEVWDRSSILNKRYREKRDRRMKYEASQDEILKIVSEKYNNAQGISYWAGHGTDPYMFQLSTNQKIVSEGAKRGKQTVMIFPELEDHGEDFDYVMEDYFYPLAKHAQGKNAKIYIRAKHTFWQANAYLPTWSRLLSGEYADVFVPAMEETTDKSMELSLASRMGIWTSGATNSWGARCARDNASYDRLRQHSHQNLPNNFLRTMIYNISYGAQYLHNFPVDQEYMSLLWDLIAKGALYVPKRSEILSFSPIHLSMKAPDEYYVSESNNNKWTTFYDQDVEKQNPRVFSRLNGTWPGAPVTEWDFSHYAAGVKERRLNFIPPYNNGMVLITPPQQGVFVQKNTFRKPLKTYLHSYYNDILKEYITDGRNYYSTDGKQTYEPKTYYKTIQKDIENTKKLLPVTVTGEVGWVVAQTSPKHLRLTLVEGGYINPKDSNVEVTFNTINPVKVKDILSGEIFKVQGENSLKINIPLGAFRFIDIELSKAL